MVDAGGMSTDWTLGWLIGEEASEAVERSDKVLDKRLVYWRVCVCVRGEKSCFTGQGRG